MMSHARWQGRVNRRYALAACWICVIACGSDPPSDPVIEDPVEVTPVGVETIAPERVRAGEPLHVACLPLDADGKMMMPAMELDYELRISPSTKNTYTVPDSVPAQDWLVATGLVSSRLC